MSLLGLLVVVIVLLLMYWAIHRVAAAFGAPAPVIAVLDVLLVIIFVLYLLQGFGVLGGGPLVPIR